MIEDNTIKHENTKKHDITIKHNKEQLIYGTEETSAAKINAMAERLWRTCNAYLNCSTAVANMRTDLKKRKDQCMQDAKNSLKNLEEWGYSETDGVKQFSQYINTCEKTSNIKTSDCSLYTSSFVPKFQSIDSKMMRMDTGITVVVRPRPTNILQQI